MQINAAAKSTAQTHEGAPARTITPYQELRRSVLACLLWENQFYESGESIGDRIARLAAEVNADAVAGLAVEARTSMNLRHVPLLLTSVLAKNGYAGTADTVAEVVQRADELMELVAIHCKVNGVGPDKAKKVLSHQMKKGLARALAKFNAYHLAKYDRGHGIKLRDVLSMCHPRPKTEEQRRLWKDVMDGNLTPPDTWEVALSRGGDKKEVWERLLREQKLGYMALLRNLRNMVSAGVDKDLVETAIRSGRGAHKVLPFRFIAAAKHAPQYEPAIDDAMVQALSQHPKLPGKTVVVIDVSGSMYHARVSQKSDMNRAQAACALAAIMREVCENPAIYATAGNDGTRQHRTEMVPARRGMALVDAVYGLCAPLGGGGIFLTPVCDYLRELEHDVDRMVVITDEQDCAIAGKDSPIHAKPLGPKGHNYLINVASYKNGVGYGVWNHVDGFSEAVIRWITEHESTAVA